MMRDLTVALASETIVVLGVCILLLIML